MRLFIAIDVPDTVKEHLAYLQRSLEGLGMRLPHPKNLHLTLNFLGEQQSTAPILEKLRPVGFKSFTLRLKEVGFFPNADTPKVLWVGLEECDELLRLQSDIDRCFTPTKSFKAHLTIGRVRHALDDVKRAAMVAQVEKLVVKSISFKVDTFKLYKSTLTPLGPIYEVIESFKATQ